MKSTSSSVPSANFMVLRAVSPSATISKVFLLVCTCTPSFSIFLRSCSPPSRSSCSAINTGENSITCVCTPSAFNAPAASSPNKPPPITTPLLLRLAVASMVFKSSMVRYTKQSLLSLPLIGGTQGFEPVAIINLSYLISRPEFE